MVEQQPQPEPVPATPSVSSERLETKNIDCHFFCIVSYQVPLYSVAAYTSYHAILATFSHIFFTVPTKLHGFQSILLLLFLPQLVRVCLFTLYMPFSLRRPGSQNFMVFILLTECFLPHLVRVCLFTLYMPLSLRRLGSQNFMVFRLLYKVFPTSLGTCLFIYINLYMPLSLRRLGFTATSWLAGTSWPNHFEPGSSSTGCK